MLYILFFFLVCVVYNESRKKDMQHQLEGLKNHSILQNDRGSLIVINAEQIEGANKILPRLDMDYLHNFYSIESGNEIDLSKLANKRIEMREQFNMLLAVVVATIIGMMLFKTSELIIKKFGSTETQPLLIIGIIICAGWVFYEWRKSLGAGKVIDKNLGLYWEGDLSDSNADSNQRENTVILKEVMLIQLAKTDLEDSVHHELNFVFSDGSRYNFLRFGDLLDANCAMYPIAKLLNVNIVAKSELIV